MGLYQTNSIARSSVPVRGWYAAPPAQATRDQDAALTFMKKALKRHGGTVKATGQAFSYMVSWKGAAPEFTLCSRNPPAAFLFARHVKRPNLGQTNQMLVSLTVLFGRFAGGAGVLFPGIV